MEMFNKIYKFGSIVKPKASLYCLGIIFFIYIYNLFNDIYSVNILIILETFIASIIIALIEYYYFNNYDELSDVKRKKNTIIWAVLSNIIIIFSAVIFDWFPSITVSVSVLLLVILEISIIAMHYSIYIVNLTDTNDLNDKLQKYQEYKKNIKILYFNTALNNSYLNNITFV